MRVEHYDAEQQRVYVLMKDSVSSPVPLPEPTDFPAQLAYWKLQCEILDIKIKRLGRTTERQTAIALYARANAMVKKYTHLVPRDTKLNAEIPQPEGKDATS